MGSLGMAGTWNQGSVSPPNTQRGAHAPRSNLYWRINWNSPHGRTADRGPLPIADFCQDLKALAVWNYRSQLWAIHQHERGQRKYQMAQVPNVVPSLSAGGTAALTLTNSGTATSAVSDLATDNGTTITVPQERRPSH